MGTREIKHKNFSVFDSVKDPKLPRSLRLLTDPKILIAIPFTIGRHFYPCLLCFIKEMSNLGEEKKCASNKTKSLFLSDHHLEDGTGRRKNINFLEVTGPMCADTRIETSKR